MKKTKKNIRTAKRWAFPIVAGAFAILQVTKGEILLALWVVMAAVFHYVASCFEDRCEDLEKDREYFITANHDLAEALKKEQAKNAELQEEINKLKA
jgi:uncharacterized protein YlxW (UPF0749 family)